MFCKEYWLSRASKRDICKRIYANRESYHRQGIGKHIKKTKNGVTKQQNDSKRGIKCIYPKWTKRILIKIKAEIGKLK